MDSNLPIRNSIISTGEFSKFAVFTTNKIETIEGLGIHTLYEQKISLEDLLEKPQKNRRLSYILPHLIDGKFSVGYSSATIFTSTSKFKNCDKEIGIEIFVPARNSSENKVLMRMIDDNFKQIMGMRIDDSKKESKNSEKDRKPLAPELNKEQIDNLHTHSHPVDDDLDPIEGIPILIFSHGLRLDPTVYRPLIEELASQGYIVLNLNHPASSSRPPLDCTNAFDVIEYDKLMTSFKEEAEEKVKNEEKLEEIDQKLGTQINRMIVTEVDNIRFIVEQIRDGNLKGLPTKCGEKNPIVLAGHSLGGTVSLQAAKEMMTANDNPPIAGCIDLDGLLPGGDAKERTAKLNVPVLLLFTKREEEDPEIDVFIENNTNSNQEVPKRVEHKVIEGVEHTDFTIYPIIDWMAGGNRLGEGIKAHTEASQAILNFMQNLEGK